MARARELVKEKEMLGVKIQVGRAPLDVDAKRLQMLREALGAEAKLLSMPTPFWTFQRQSEWRIA